MNAVYFLLSLSHYDLACWLLMFCGLKIEFLKWFIGFFLGCHCPLRSEI